MITSRCCRKLVVGNAVGRVFDSVATLPPVTMAEVRNSPHAQFKKSKDVVSQVISLARSQVAVSDPVWPKLADTVTHSLQRLDGADFATVVKAFAAAGYRDELMLVGIGESLKQLCRMGRVRPQNIADIVSGFHGLNFVPSVEVLHALASQTEKAVKLYKTRPIDLCRLFRYFSILESNPHLCVGYVSHRQTILSALESEIEKRIGFFGPVEIAIAVRYLKKMSLRQLVENFTRTENCRQHVREYFIRQLDRRFGDGAWKQYYHLFRQTQVDSTGWGMVERNEESESDDEDNLMVKRKPQRSDFELFSVDEAKVKAALDSLSVTAAQCPRAMHVAPKHAPPQHVICQEQIEALALLEEEVGLERRPRLVSYNDQVAKRDKRVEEHRDYERKGPSRNLKKLKKFRAQKKSSLMKFAIIATARRKLVAYLFLRGVIDSIKSLVDPN